MLKGWSILRLSPANSGDRSLETRSEGGSVSRLNCLGSWNIGADPSLKNRSGRYSIGRSKCLGSWNIGQCHTATSVPSGTKWPAMFTPPLGTVRSGPIGTGGKYCIASFRQASIYGKFMTEAKVISLSEANEERISCVNLVNASGCFNKMKVMAVRSVAVVSEPAIKSALALPRRCSNWRF
jgi:hypothetical protein